MSTLALVAAATILGLAGCGGTASSSSTQSQLSADNSSAATRQFNGNPEITKFGTTGSAEERHAASAVLAKNLEARENGDFTVQCETLSIAVQKEIAGSTSKSQLLQRCSRRLEQLALPLKKTAEARADTFRGSIEELRVKGAKAWALYRGTDGKEYAMLLQRESGTWSVGAIGTSLLGS